MGRSRRDRGGIDAWPGYVDALATLLMVIIFVLLVFVLSQGFLSVALSSRDQALERLNRQVSELGELLALERGQAEELRGSLGRIGDELRAAATARDAAQGSLAQLRGERDRLAAERDATRGERDTLAARMADLEATARGGAARVVELETRLSEALARIEAVGGDAARTAGSLSESQRALAAERQALEATRRDLAGVRDQAAALGRDLEAERQALAARQQELAASRQQGQALTRDLEAERRALAARQQELAASQQQAQALTRDLAAERQTRAATAQQLTASQQQAQALARDLEAERRAREGTAQQLATSQLQAQALTRDLEAERRAREATAQQLAASQLQAQSLTRERDTTRQELEARRREAEGLARDLAAARQTLEGARRDLAALRDEAARLDRTVQTDRATIEARLSDIARLNQQLAALTALRDQLEQRAQQAMARAAEEERQRSAAQRTAEEAARARAAAEALVAQATGRATQAERLAAEAAARGSAAERNAAEAARARADAERLAAEAAARGSAAERAAAEAARQREAAAQRAAEEERRRRVAEGRSGEFARLSESAQAQVALLSSQLQQLRAELGRVAAALDLAETEGRDRDAQIAVLGQRLNAALAARVEELQSYRSDFFGRLRRVLGERPEVRIVGDRFVFQSEVLFPVGGADLSPAGAQQIRDLGRVLLEIAAQFPRDLNWVLRVDGHADRSPIRGGGRFANNWELSAARSIAVTQLLIAEGLPRNRAAAVAFGDTQPLDDRDTPEAYARNRRIELRLEAAPAPAPDPAQPARAGLPEVVAGLDCARLTVSQGQGGAPGGLVVSGLGLRGTAGRLRAALPAGTPAPRLAIAEFDGPYCGVLEALRSLPAGGVPASVVGSARMPVGSMLQVDLDVPAWASQVTLFFLDTNGEVATLQTLDRRGPGTRIRLGEPQGGFTGWAVAEPLGTDLVLAIASEGPLFPTPRPDVAPAEAFAAALRDTLAEARAAGRRVAAGAVAIDVVPR